MNKKEFKPYKEEESIIRGSKLGDVSLPPDIIDIPHLISLSNRQSIEDFRNASKDREVVIEVGPGKGRFLQEVAQIRRGNICLGIDIRLSFCLRSLKGARDKGLDNIWVAYGDARMLIPILVNKGQAVEAYILFPDPWWKRRHAKRRHGFLMAKTLSEALREGGMVVIKSDVEEYLGEIERAFLETRKFYRSDIRYDLPLSNRELKIRALGGTYRDVVFIKRESDE